MSLARLLSRAARAALVALVAAAPVGCGDDDASTPVRVQQRFVSDAAPGCLYASPLWVEPGGVPFVLSVSEDGLVRGLDPDTGAVRGEVRLVAPEGERPQLLATPVVVDDRWAVLAWQDVTDSFARRRHRVAVVDLERWSVATDFPELVLRASEPTHDGEGTVVFDSTYQLLRARLVHLPDEGDGLGKVYVSLGNGPSIQPFHGWVFELDLDAWRASTADDPLDDAVSAVLLTTAEDDCFDGHGAMTCGGGVWNAAGPQLVDDVDGRPALLVPTGNGRVDFDRGAFAHAVLRVGEGLDFDPGCDPDACTPFDELDPDPACLASCANVFVPRLGPGDPPLDGGFGAPAFRQEDAPQLEAGETFPDCDPPSGRLSFLECYGALDADLGANSPVLVPHPGGEGRLVVQAGKDGALYLFDQETMGVMYDRLQLMPFCGTPDAPCTAFWAGTLVTQPATTTIDGTPVVVLPAFIADSVHAAGIFAVDVVLDDDGRPSFRRRWQAPDPARPGALERFRHHAGRPVVLELAGEPHVAVLEVERSPSRGPGTLWVVRIRDGVVVAEQPITDGGNRYVLPLVRGDDLYLNTCDKDGRTLGRLEAFRFGGGR